MNVTLQEWALLCDQQAARAAEPDLSELLQGEVLDIVNEGIAANFSGAHAPDGTPWPPRKGEADHPLLIKSGTMHDEAAGEVGYVIVTPSSLTKGVETDYAPFQEFGTQSIPARPFMGVGDEFAERIADKLADGVLEMIFGESLE